jgi:hypothetical protein
MPFRLTARTLPFASVLALAGVHAACSSGDSPSNGSGGASGETKTLPCDVSTVLEGHCQSCHGAKPSFGAPMPLVSYADLTAPAKSDATKAVYELVGTRIHDDASPMPQAPSPRLSAADTATLDAWIAAKAPAATESCPNETTSSAASGSGGSAPTCTPDLNLRSTAWTMPKDTEDAYVCYGVDVTVGAKKQIVGIYPGVDNATIVHHMLMFELPNAIDPSPTLCDGSSMGGRLVAVWAPGGDGLAFPAEAGLPLEGTKHYMVQIHYSNLNHLDGEKDASGFDLCTTSELRPNDADIVAFGGMKFSIPAQSKLDLTCDLKIPTGTPDLHVFSGMPHMHKLGTAIRATLLPASGPVVDLGTREPWDFDTQYWSNNTATLKAGDTVRTRCQWQNTTGTNVGFGPKTSDEMCFAFTAYWPKVASLSNWEIPALLATCAETK